MRLALSPDVRSQSKTCDSTTHLETLETLTHLVSFSLHERTGDFKRPPFGGCYLCASKGNLFEVTASSPSFVCFFITPTNWVKGGGEEFVGQVPMEAHPPYPCLKCKIRIQLVMKWSL